jgi:interleukin-1 receptor-associated kinase 1
MERIEHEETRNLFLWDVMSASLFIGRKHNRNINSECIHNFFFFCLSTSTDRSLDLEWNIRYKIIIGICNGLHFLHEECRIIHLDLKPENILMDSNMKPKIADFGLSRLFREQQSKVFTDNRAGTR